MKNKQTDTKLRSGVGFTRHLISGVLCLAVISLICARASAQNLFAGAGGDIVLNNTGTIYKFTPTGVRTTFASGLASPFALAFDSRGNLFVADGGTGYDIIVGAAVYKFTPSGLRSTVASENDQVSVIPNGLA